jgi:hypothetical protein
MRCSREGADFPHSLQLGDEYDRIPKKYEKVGNDSEGNRLVLHAGARKCARSDRKRLSMYRMMVELVVEAALAPKVDVSSMDVSLKSRGLQTASKGG